MLRGVASNILSRIKKVGLPSRPRAFSIFQYRSKKQEHPTKSTPYRGILNNCKTDVALLQTCRFFSQDQPQKKFTVNGAITSLTRAGYYFVDPAEENRRVLLPGIYNGSFVLLYGPRGSGKSTRMYKAMEQLQDDFICLSVSFQNGIDFDDKRSFWKSFGERLLKNHPSIFKDKLLFTSAGEFSSLFEASNKDMLFQGKNVVLFIDEFDRLYQGPQEVIDSMLDTLRGIKQERVSYCLQSFIGVGPFSILALTGKSSSPFNVRDAIQVRYWTREEVHQLFAQYPEVIDSRIVDDIYERTAGHPGLVCLCGKVIDEKALDTIKNYKSWIQYATSMLTKQALAWPTMQKMVETLSSSLTHAKSARNLLRTRFLPSGTQTVVLDVTEDENNANFLAAEGALLFVEPSVFRIPSPLVHQLLLEKVATVDRHSAPPLPVPFCYTSRGQPIDTVKMVSHAIEYINPAAIQSAYRISCKKSRMPGSRDQLVPQEAIYHTEMYSVLRSWLPNDIMISTQVNVANTGVQLCAMSIDVSPNHKILLEFVANEPIKSVEDHIERARTYATLLNAQEVWVIHFTVKEQSKEFKYPWLSSARSTDIPINIMHVWHSYPFDQVKIYLSEDKVIEVPLMKLSK